MSTLNRTPVGCLATVALAWLSTSSLLATPQVSVAVSPASPQPLGTVVTFAVTASDTDPGVLNYRFSLGLGNGNYRVLRDFSVSNTFSWAQSDHEATDEILITVKNKYTQQKVSVSRYYQTTTRVSGSSPVASQTANPLVALFSAAPCAVESSMRVRFQQLGKSGSFVTNVKPCSGTTSMNFYVAGMLPETTYWMRAETITSGVVAAGSSITFTTGAIPAGIITTTSSVPVGFNGQDSTAETLVVWGQLNGIPFATNLAGKVLWYCPQSLRQFTRLLSDGSFLGISDGPNTIKNNGGSQTIRRIDLAGNILQETNNTRVSEQLAAMGLPSDCRTPAVVGQQCTVTNFNHEATRLSNGHTLVLANTEKIYPAGTQGSTQPIDIVGILVIDLDENFQVAWYWNAYDHMDINRAAVLGETCSKTSRACVALISDTGNDWLHANTIYYRPDGQILVSFRHQDWVVKIDYSNGTGTGNVLWRLGAGGDFTIVPDANDPFPWFSHQHDTGYELGGMTILSVYDNGNTRNALYPGSHSRGQVLNVNETNMTMSLQVNADLGGYADAYGSAHRLANGNYQFGSGDLTPQTNLHGAATEVLPNGTIGYQCNERGQSTYRSFRVVSLYAPPPK